MNKKEDILDAWIMVEQLAEGDINVRSKSLKSFDEIKNEDYHAFLLDAIKKKNFKKEQKGGVVIYFDIFNFVEVVNILRERYNLEPTNEDIRIGNKFSFALCFDKNINLCEEMTFFTVSAYLRWYKEIVSRNVFKEFESNFRNLVSQFFEIEEKQKDNKPRLFNEAMKKLLNKYGIDITNCRMQVVNNLETEATNLHSFFIADLEKAKLISTEKLDTYLLGKKGERINLDSKNSSPNFNPVAFCELLQPKNYPIARFPSNTKHSLSLMQQIAVNLSLGYDKEQIRSVNGPPGTGKTTLLNDIFAELIVRQAFDVTQLSQKTVKGNVSTRYYEKASIGELPSVLAEKGIVVASTNNGAVKKIVNELALIKDVDEGLIGELKNADYFMEISNSKVSTKWIEEDINEHKKEVLVKEKNEGIDNYWGVFSLEGGKSENIANIVTNLKHIVAYLNNEYISDDTVYDEFIKQYELVNSMREDLQKDLKNMENCKECCTLLEQLKKNHEYEHKEKEQNLKELTEKQRIQGQRLFDDIEKIREQQNYILRRKTNNEKNRISLQVAIQSSQKEKPWIFASRKTKIEYKIRLEELNKKLLGCVEESENIEAEEIEINDKLDKLSCEKKLMHDKIKNAEIEFEIWVKNRKEEIDKIKKQSEEYKQQLEGKTIKLLDMGLEYEKLQEFNPWFDEDYRIAQSRLFILALKVRKQFLFENRNNIKAAIIIWSKQNEYLDKKHIILAAWNWINMTIPVISSTFASFSNMFKNIGTEMLGYLFIDEAGQALPQASVGAIYRSKQVIVVGDPSQIKPVLTLDSNVLSMLGEHFNVSEKYLSNTTSTQTLADEISKFGFYKEENEWVGIPLWVHRRCKYPMFTISNKISYNGLMVQAKKEYGKAEWYDIKGKANDKYVKEQGDFLVKKIKEMIQMNPKIIDTNEKDTVFVITPFTNVAYQLAQALEQVQFTRYDDKGKSTNVGTVHTFQGKEAPIVFLVLGADDNSRGAARWAMEEPNIMNVAATRAKEEFYIIGDKNLYLGLNCDTIANTYTTICQYKELLSELV